jgi:hypothetical protein
MSTDMQQHSLENQSEAIAVYAARRGLTIVRLTGPRRVVRLEC